MKLSKAFSSTNQFKTPTRQCSVKSGATAPMTDETMKSESEGWYENAYFHEELSFIRVNVNVTKVTLKDFVVRHEKDDLLALGEIIKANDRKWKVIKFQDVIEDTNMRRWQYKKEALQRCVDTSLQEAGLLHKVTVMFDETLKLDMDDKSKQAMVSLLQEAQKDEDIKAIALDGFIATENVEAVVNALIKLIRVDDRRWKSVVFRCSFDGEDYEEWDGKISAARKRLEEIKAKRETPIEFAVC